MSYTTRDSGKKRVFGTWFQRDTGEEKLRFDLIPIDQLERLAGQYTRWASKCGESNRQKARWKKEIDVFRQSAHRHFIKWMKWEYDEDRASALMRNIMWYERHRDHGHDKDKYEEEDGVKKR